MPVGNDETFRYSDADMLASIDGANLFDDKAILVFLDAGSEQNIPADLFLKGVMNYAGFTEIPARTVHRMDLFGDISDRKVPLWMIES